MTTTGLLRCATRMQVEFQDDDLDSLEIDPSSDGGLPRDVVRKFRQRMQAIRDAVDERDLYALRSWRFKKLRGARSHQRSIRLNKQWRLIVEVRESTPSNVMVIVAIEDYHKG